MLRGMARRADGGDQALVEVKAVDGRLSALRRASRSRAAATRRRCSPSATASSARWPSPSCSAASASTLGDTVLLGEAKLTLRGVIADEPDRLAAGFAFGPRLMIARPRARATGLVQPGSLVDWHYRVRLAGEADNAALKAIAASGEHRLPDGGLADAHARRCRARAPPEHRALRRVPDADRPHRAGGRRRRRRQCGGELPRGQARRHRHA